MVKKKKLKQSPVTKAEPRSNPSKNKSTINPDKWGKLSIVNLQSLFLFFFAFILYANTFHHEYALDDSVAIIENKFTKQGIHGIPDLLTKDLFAGIYGKGLDIGGGRYRPLSLVTFALEYQFFGQNPHISHFINVLLYAITAVILMLLLLQMFPGKMLFNFIVALLFIAHPLHTEVVANIKSRDELLCFIGFMLTLLFVLKYLKVEKLKYMIFACLSFIFALFSKESAITLLATIPLTVFCFGDEKTKSSIKRIFTITLPFIIIGIFFIMLRAKLVGMIGDKGSNDIMENPFAGIGIADKLATISLILGKYLLLLFFPHPLSCDYSYNQIPIIGWDNPWATGSLILYLALLIYAVKFIFKKDIISYGILFFLMPLFLVSNIIFNIGAPMGERFLYIPSVGFCIIIAYLLLKGLGIGDEGRGMKNTPITNPKSLIPLLAILLPIVLAFSYKTYSRNKEWKDNLTIFGADALTVPNSAKIHYYYGNTLLQKGLNDKKLDSLGKATLFRESKLEFEKAIAINPKFHLCYYNMGLVYEQFGQPDSAIHNLKKVLELQPTHILTQGTLGGVYGKLKGNYDSAIYYLKTAVKYNPEDAGSMENLGIAYAMKGNIDEAIPVMERSLKLRPAEARNYMNLALAWQSKGNKEKADSYFEKAFKIDPSLRKN